MRTTSKLRVLLPLLGLTAGVVVLGTAALSSGSSDFVAPATGQLPAKADAVAITPDDLSTAATSRDWQETAGSATRKKWK